MAETKNILIIGAGNGGCALIDLFKNNRGVEILGVVDLNPDAPGMKLAKVVKNKRGMVLCSAGTELNEDIIARLARMEIDRITVEGHPVDTVEPEKNLAQRIDELNNRFKHVAGDALMKKIQNVLLKLLREKAE